PFVSGAAALLASQNPALLVADIKSTLMNTVDKLTQWSGKVASGGRMNLARAMQSIGGVVSPPPPTTTYQPDMQIRTQASSTYAGGNVYGFSQSVSQSVTAGSAAIYQLALQNDGSGSDTITVTGPSGGAGWTVRYYNATAGGADITSQVTGAGWSTGVMAAGATLQFRAEVVPASTVAGGSSYTVSVAAKSAGDTTRSDAVQGVTSVTSAPTSTPVTAVSLTTSPITPQPINTAITLTATAVGGPAQYQFSIGRNMVWYTSWTTLQNYSTSPTAVWKPTATGNYQVRVYARTVGNTASYQASKIISYTIK
ncbi:MAG TPA: hypothetical protein VGM23_13605, partial [Armatimonadota bacterium]